MNPTLLAAALGVALGFAGLLAADRMLEQPPPQQTFPILEQFPNVLLKTHDGRTVRFYDDLIKGKTVGLNFMYVRCKDF